MGCAGSNPLPEGDGTSATANGRAASLQMADGEQPCTVMQKAMSAVNADEVVKKIQDVTNNMENLMDETQEKIGSFFGKAEQKVEDAEQQVDDALSNTTSTVPEIIPMPDATGWTETMDNNRKDAEDSRVEELPDDDDGNAQEETNE